MTENRSERSRNEFHADKHGTPGRSLAEAQIDRLREEGGVFVQAVRATRMPMVVADPSLPGNPIVFANQAFLRLSGYSMAEVLGQQPYFMNGEGTNPTDAVSFLEALEQDRDAVIETVQYRKDGSRFVAAVLVTTFKDEYGQILYHFLSYLDITRQVTAEAHLVSSKKTEAEARESEERLRAILESALDYAIFTTDAHGRIETWPPGAEAVFGWTAEEAIGRDMALTFVPEDRENGVPDQERREAREQGHAPDVRWHLHKDGRRVFIDGSTRPILGDGAEPHGYLKVGQDRTERHEWQERQSVLLAELQHRTRNLMGVVSSMFDKTRRSSASVEDLAKTYADRLAALARVQSLLSRLNAVDRITFDDLIRTELSAMGALDAQGRAERVRLDGPQGVRLRSSSVQTFALALHELATNATKYGALAQTAGRLAVKWRVLGATQGPRLRIEWVESGVAMPEPGRAPQGSGYGRELIERALPYQLNAETSYKLGAEGVHCTIELPLSDDTRTEEYENA